MICDMPQQMRVVIHKIDKNAIKAPIHHKKDNDPKMEQKMIDVNVNVDLMNDDSSSEDEDDAKFSFGGYSKQIMN